MSDPKQQILEILAEVTGKPVGGILPTHDLAGDLDMGSAEAMELLAEVEDRFEIDIPEVEAAKLRSVADVLAFVESRGQGAG
jgi:acyl carrier protein